MIITKHAVEKYKEHLGSEKTLTGLGEELLTMYKRAKVYYPPVGYRVRSLINHGFSATNYYKFDYWIFVVCGDVIVTVYKDTYRYSKWNKVKKRKRHCRDSKKMILFFMRKEGDIK